MHDRDTEESANIRRFSRFQRLLHDIKDAETEAQAHCRLEWALQHSDLRDDDPAFVRVAAGRQEHPDPRFPLGL